MADVIDAIAPLARFTEMIDQSPDRYFVPILEAVRDHGCGFASIPQNAGAFRLPDHRPMIVILDDDFPKAKGPTAFDAASVTELVRVCPFAVVVSSGAYSGAYEAAANLAVVKQKNVVLVRTRRGAEIAWTQLVRRMRRNIQILTFTRSGGGGQTAQ